MTKKHFEIVARLLAEIKAEATDKSGRGLDWSVGEAIDVLAGDLAVVFKELNPRFDVARFIEATKEV